LKLASPDPRHGTAFEEQNQLAQITYKDSVRTAQITEFVSIKITERRMLSKEIMAVH
jgi:hypothetical protein